MVLQELISKIGFSVDTRPLQGIEHKLEHISHRLEFLAAAEILKGIFEIAEKFSSVGEALETASIGAGITAESFQELAYAASQNAVGQEQLSAALARVSRTLNSAKEGSAGAAARYAKLGITPDQLRGFHNSREAFLAVADSLARIEDPIKRAAMAQDLFGRSGIRLVKFAAKGSQEIQRLEREARSLNVVLSTEGVEALAEFEDAFSGFKQVVSSQFMRLGAAVAPALTFFIHDIEKLWMSNQKLLGQDFGDWGYDIGFLFGFIYEHVRLTTQAVVDFVGQHPQLVAMVAKIAGALLLFSLGTTALQMLFKGVSDSVRSLIGIFSIGAPVIRGFYLAGSGAARILLRLTGRLFVMLANAIYVTFPALGEAINVIGQALLGLSLNPIFLTIAGAVAAFGAIVLAVQAIWALLHGKSFWDTWLGEGLQAIMKYGKKALGIAKYFLGEGDGGEEPGKLGDAGKGAAAAPPGGMLPDFSLDDLNFRAVQAANAVGMPPPSIARPFTPQPFVGDPSDRIMPTINAPITIHATSQDGRDLGDQIGLGIKNHLGSLLRETQRDVAPAGG